MPRQANGNFIQPANTAAISGTSITATAFNTLVSDIGMEITNSLDRGGRSAMTAALPMGGNKITGMADPTVATDATTKAYVDAIVALFFSTGDIKPTLKSIPDSGWLMFDDGTFGNAASGSSNSNSAANQALFALLFNSPFTDANIPIFTAGGGATTRAAQVSASAAWAANCRMSLPKALGRAFGAAGAGSGSGLTLRALGQTLGEETHLLVAGEIPTITSGVSTSGTLTGSTNGINNPQSQSSTGGGAFPVSGQYATQAIGVTVSGSMSGSATSNNTGGAAHNNMPPTTFVNWMVKQ
jgi:microcystin-dependent protein